MSEIEALIQFASEITTIGVLLLWLRAERNDNNELWNIISELVRIRLRHIEQEESHETFASGD